MFKAAKIYKTLLTSIFAILFGFFFISKGTFCMEKEDKPSLSKSYPLETIQKILIPREDWRPFPTADERQPWISLPENIRRGHIALGEKALGYKWSYLPATLFLEFAWNGNRSNYESGHFSRRRTLANLVIAECMEGKGRFINDIVNGIWAICEESYWGVPAHVSLQKMGPGLPDIAEPTIDLFAAETGALLAWTYYLLGPRLDNVSPLIRTRILQEADKRILTPFLKRNDFWWMGFDESRTVNNWNPWCNSNCLTAALILEQDEEKRRHSVYKSMKSLDRFIKPYPLDGSCDEGPGYWNRAGASLFECLELLGSATNGEINLFKEPLIKEMGRYIYRVHIAEDYFINFADASAKVEIAGNLTFRYGRKIDDKQLARFGAHFAQKNLEQSSTVSGGIARILPALFCLKELIAAETALPVLRDVWLKDLNLMAARSKDSSYKGLYIAAKGGTNGESHNHNDVGSFIVYADGRPVIIDAGVETYTKKTFSSQRYDIWTMQSAYHNLPVINGVMQKAGRTFAARNVSYKSNNSYAQMTMDIAGAYPAEAFLDSWIRTIRMNRGENINITDSYKLKKSTGDLTLNLMTPCNAAIESPGKLTLKDIKTALPAVSVQVHFDSKKFTPTMENITIEDSRLKAVWGSQITRIILRADKPKLQDTFKFTITQ